MKARDVNALLQLEGLEDSLRAIVREEVERALSAQTGADGFLHVAGAASFLGVSEDALRGLVKRRALPFHKRSGRLYFSRAELSAWIREAA